MADWEELDDAPEPPSALRDTGDGAPGPGDDGWMPAATAPELDLPVLLVNWTRVTSGRITKRRVLAGLARDAEAEQARVVDEIARAFEVEAERLFDEQLCVHSTVGAWMDDAARLEAIMTDDYFSMVPYPGTVGDGAMPLAEAWALVQRPSRFRSVTALKLLLARCSRTLLWKVLMAIELEEMAERLAAHSTRHNELPNGADDGLNVLDRVIAMVLDRQPPTAVSQHATEAERFQDLARRHWILKGLWLSEFGALPH